MLNISGEIEILSRFSTPPHVFNRKYGQAFSRKNSLAIEAIMQIIIKILFSLSFIFSLFGYGEGSCEISSGLIQNYSSSISVYSRSSENFSGKLPSCPRTPNCVNSQRKSDWGSLYDVAPLNIPNYVSNPMDTLKTLLQYINMPYFKSENLQLEEETDHYLHYTYTVVIPKGVFKGVYIDDLDIYYDEVNHVFHLRSASRTGFRDATHLNFKRPWAFNSLI